MPEWIRLTFNGFKTYKWVYWFEWFRFALKSSTFLNGRLQMLYANQMVNISSCERVERERESSITNHHSDKEICLSINNFIVIENSIEDKSLNSMRIFGKYWIYVLRCNLNGALILRGLFTVNVNLHSDLHAVTLWSDCVVTAKIRVYSSSTGSNNRFDYVKFIERCVLAVVTQSNEG